MTLSDNDLIINNLSPGTGAQDSNIITVGVSTNVWYGYDLYETARTKDNDNPYSYDKLNNGNLYYPDNIVTKLAAGDHA